MKASPALAADACATAGSNFTRQQVAAGTAGIRSGCARDAGTLRTLARSDTDVIVAIDLNPSERPADTQRFLTETIDRVRAGQARGLTLSASLDEELNRVDTDIYRLDPDVTFDGTIQVVDNSMVIVAPAGEVRAAANWWQKLIATTVSLAVAGVAWGLCLAAFNAGALLATRICTGVAGGFAGLIADLMNSWFDGRSLGDGEVWMEALVVAAVSAIGSAFLPELAAWVQTRAPAVLASIQQTMRNFIARWGAWSNPLPLIVDLFNSDLATVLANLLDRLRRVGSTTVRPAKIMVVGDSLSQGQEGDYTWRYRLSQWLQENNMPVDFVGPYHGTFTQDPPGPPQPPLFIGEKAPAKHRVNGGYAAGITFDTDHFAHWGRQAAQVKNEIRQQVATYRPDMIVLALGFNDLGWFVSDEIGTMDSIATIIDEARAAQPGVDFVVANVPQRSRISWRDDLITKTTNYNRLLATVRPQLNKAISRVEIADWENGYTCRPDDCPAAYDGLHPNNWGEYQLASAISRTLREKYGFGINPSTTPPPFPARPTPTPANVRAASSDYGVTVTWNPVYGAIGYDVRWRIKGQSSWTEGSVWNNRLDTTWTKDGIEWEYQVRTRGGDTVKGPWSGIVGAIARPKTAPPPLEVISTPAASGAGIDVEIRPPTGPYTDTIDRYELIIFDEDQPGDLLQSYGFRGTRVHLGGLRQGHRYRIAVATWNAVSGGLPGGARSVVAGVQTPPVPTNLRVSTVDPTTVQLNWNASPGAAGYRLWKRNASETGSIFYSSDWIMYEPSHREEWLYPGAWNFEFCVTAINGSLESPKSNCVRPPRPAGMSPAGGGTARASAPVSDQKVGPFTARTNPDGTTNMLAGVRPTAPAMAGSH
ncbi:SGNH/GDSL hydrolase family protein [Micromonospora sp. DT233]|uniref:SGNH/GDSL hydrolase family protein n=1 Tax=Micromonospora sp. DT233 TaxID=3393432 RepID=UPI003CEA1AF0